MNTKLKKTEKETKASGAEKPISLYGPSFTEVLGALLKTKPMTKEEMSDKPKEKKGA